MCAPLTKPVETKKRILTPEWKAVEVGNKKDKSLKPPKVFAVYSDDDIKILDNGSAARPRKERRLPNRSVGKSGP